MTHPDFHIMKIISTGQPIQLLIRQSQHSRYGKLMWTQPACGSLHSIFLPVFCIQTKDENAQSTISLGTVSAENFSRQRHEKAQGKSDSSFNVPVLDDHQNAKVTLPPGYRKASTNTLKMPPTEHYLQLLHFPDNVHCYTGLKGVTFKPQVFV